MITEFESFCEEMKQNMKTFSEDDVTHAVAEVIQEMEKMLGVSETLAVVFFAAKLNLKLFHQDEGDTE